MRRFIPGHVELMVFAVAAIVCAAIVSHFPQRDVGLAMLSMPLFISAAVVGMIRSGRYAADGSLARPTQPEESVDDANEA